MRMLKGPETHSDLRPSVLSGSLWVRTQVIYQEHPCIRLQNDFFKNICVLLVQYYFHTCLIKKPYFPLFSIQVYVHASLPGHRYLLTTRYWWDRGPRLYNHYPVITTDSSANEVSRHLHLFTMRLLQQVFKIVNGCGFKKESAGNVGTPYYIHSHSMAI